MRQNCFYKQRSYRRGIRLQLYRQCDPTVNRLVEDMENKLFTSVNNNDKHVCPTSYLMPIITLIISGLGDMKTALRVISVEIGKSC